MPPAAYVCVGVAELDVPVSPNAQLRLAIVPSLSVDVSVNEQVRPTQLLVNEAVGGLFTGGVVAHVYPTAQLAAASFAWPATDGWK